jgi:hypothetical protein
VPSIQRPRTDPARFVVPEPGFADTMSLVLSELFAYRARQHSWLRREATRCPARTISLNRGRAQRHSASWLTKQLGATFLLQPKDLAFDGAGMVEQTVEDGSGQHLTPEHVTSIDETLVPGDDEAASTLVAAHDQLKRRETVANLGAVLRFAGILN